MPANSRSGCRDPLTRPASGVAGAGYPLTRRDANHEMLVSADGLKRGAFSRIILAVCIPGTAAVQSAARRLEKWRTPVP